MSTSPIYRSKAHDAADSLPSSPPLPVLSTTLPGFTAFDRAVHVVNVSNRSSQQYHGDDQLSVSGPGSDQVSFTAEEHMLLYGAYKQATQGDVKGHKPTIFDITARSKWQAWANMRGRSKVEAKDSYVDLVVKALTRPGSHPDLHMLADEILQRPPTPPLLPKAFIPVTLNSAPVNASASTHTVISQPLANEEPSAIHSIYPSTNTSTIQSMPRVHSTLQPARKGSISESIRSSVAGGLRSAATSVYELADEAFTDNESVGTEPSGLEISSRSESDGAKDILSGSVYSDKALSIEGGQESKALGAQPTESRNLMPRSSVDLDRNGMDADDESYDIDEDEDEVYQSSVEYDDASQDGHDTMPSEQTQSSPATAETTVAPVPPRRYSRQGDDFVDEGVFDEDEKDDHDTRSSVLLQKHSDNATFEQLSADDATLLATYARTKLRNGSMSSGYGGSVFSDKESSVLSMGRSRVPSIHKGLFGREEAQDTLPVEPYVVNAVYSTDVNVPTVENALEVTSDGSSRGSSTANDDSPTPAVEPSPSSLAVEAQTVVQDSTVAQALVCPVSKKSAASGGVCPAALFAMAKQQKLQQISTQVSESTIAPTENGTSKDTIVPSSDAEFATSVDTQSSIATTHHSEEGHHHTLAPSGSVSVQPTSAASVAPTTSSQGIRQNIVSRFSALRNSLAAASSRASSLGLSNGSPSATNEPGSTNGLVVLKDPISSQSITVVCPHSSTAQALETEVVRLQTEVTVLHERLDLLQESLKIRSQTQALERRSARGIIKLVLRQGLINALLLLLVFAVLYKRRSPIAFAILAYIGQGRKEGEAGWRALLRWGADLIRRGERNRRVVYQAGHRNGYW